ncbi:hypothetical protein SAMN04488056_104206 [Cohaesibacter marisflavi]|uniref:Uncharacterized protein n=1 Tax=Cohaesibacter marisflavi TaxID=655353 RepID=A0A1I5FVH9_9HYPH|nr:hypothetical protein [Cohaesibacter marisflavi]SFO27191.1 hypothetical protein SAMN04488056_104206 [Cohaesibacter marisflavi]
MKRTSLTLGFLLVSTALVHAQSDAETAWDAIFKDMNQSGLLTATNGSVHYNEATDSLTVQNLVFKTDFSLPVPTKRTFSEESDDTAADGISKEGKSKSELKIALKIALPTAVYTGLRLEEAGYAYDSMTIDTMTGSFDIDAPGTADDTHLKLETTGKSTITAAYSPFLGEFKLAPSRPIGSVMDYIRPLLMQTRYENTSVEGMIAKQYVDAYQDAVQTTETGPMQVSDVKNGRIGSYEVAYQKTDMVFDSKNSFPPESDLAQGNPAQVTYTINKTRYEGYDIGALLSVIDPNAAPIEGTKSVLEKSEMAGINVSVPNLAEIKIGPASQSDITVKQPATYLVPLLDKMIAEDLNPDDLSEEDQQALIESGFDLARSFAMGLTEIGKTEASITLPSGPYLGQKATLGFESIRQAGFSSYGIEESSISGMTYAGPPAMSFKLGRLAIEDLEFADYQLIKQAIFNSMKGNPPQGSEAVKLGPNALTLALKDLAYEDSKGNALSANEVNLHYDRIGLAIPAEVTTKIDNLTIAKSMLQHPLAGVLLDQLGLDSVTINEELAMTWDDESQTFQISPIKLELPNIVSLSGSLGAGGIMRDYLENPETAQAAMATASVLPASLTLKDLGGLDDLIKLAGVTMGMGPDQTREMASMQLRAVLSGFTEAAFYDSVVKEVDMFLKDPQSLMVSLNPSNPVPVAQLLGVAATAPQQIPYLLAIGVIANDN